MSRRTDRLPALLAVLACACGPVTATSVIGDAEVSLARAHAADGEKYAPYDTTLADLYLVKAKEEQGHAHYSEAAQLASEALKHADAATRKAAERRTSGPPAPTATVQHPAEPAAPAPAPRPVAPPPVPPEKPKTPVHPGNP